MLIMSRPARHELNYISRLLRYLYRFLDPVFPRNANQSLAFSHNSESCSSEKFEKVTAEELRHVQVSRIRDVGETLNVVCPSKICPEAFSKSM